MADKDRKRLFSKEQLRSLIQEENIKTTDDIQRVLKEMFGDVLQEALDAELGHNLGYEKNDTACKETANRRNGHSSKTIRSEYGDVELAIPRDRDGEFEPVIVKKHQKNVAGIEDQIISLYARGISTREIQDHFQQLYGVEVSPTLISNVTNKIMPVVKDSVQ
jgi:transposase-like protein